MRLIVLCATCMDSAGEDLRESGSIEQDADVVIFIYRDEYYRAESENKGIADIEIAKQRNGATGRFELRFIKEMTRFENF